MSILSFMPVIGQVVDKVLDFIPDPAEKAKAAAAYRDTLIQSAIAADRQQTAVNTAEAGNASVFVAGWRPAIGWVCAGSLALYYGPTFLVGQGLWIWASIHSGRMAPRPDLGITDIMGLLGPMLGLGTMRTVEKLQGVARSTLGKG